jgi:protein-S-isoprenylcysteine O-methyltransferase Ste14
MGRLVALTYGCLAYLLFLTTFLWTIGFVEGAPWVKNVDTGPGSSVPESLVVDGLLLALFAVQHSVMARRWFKQGWTRWVPSAVERSTYVLAATLVVSLLLWKWRPLPAVVWSVDNSAVRSLLWAVSALGWGILLLATFLINHFELFGLQQVYNNWRGQRFAPPGFRTPALYKYTRHPLYLGFILAFWATPRMTQGHLLFAIATTAYIFVGIFFEERDLLAHFGDEYRRYRERVPMILPLLGRKSAPLSQSRPDASNPG